MKATYNKKLINKLRKEIAELKEKILDDFKLIEDKNIAFKHQMRLHEEDKKKLSYLYDENHSLRQDLKCIQRIVDKFNQ